MKQRHFTKLENMYLGANFNREIYDTTTIKISEGQAEVGLEIAPKYFHALGAIHGSVYFRMLDDAAFFAVNSIVEDAFVLTTSFNLNLIRPASSGTITAIGKVKYRSKNLFVAEATLYNQEGKEIAFGTGNFAKSKFNFQKKLVTNKPDDCICITKNLKIIDYQQIMNSEEVIRASFNRQQFMRYLGANLISVEAGKVKISCAYDEKLTQQNGYFHAGVLTSIVDVACGYAALSQMPAGSDVLSVEFKINLMRPAQTAKIIAIGEVLKAGRTLSVCQGTVWDEQEEVMIANMQATMICIQR